MGKVKKEHDQNDFWVKVNRIYQRILGTLLEAKKEAFFYWLPLSFWQRQVCLNLRNLSFSLSLIPRRSI